MEKAFKTKEQSGMAALITVVVVGAATLAMVVGANFLGMAGLATADSYQQGQAAVTAADSCINESLRRLKINPNYTAVNQTLFIDNYSCIINIVANSNQRLVTAQSTIGRYHSNIRAEANIKDGINIQLTNWTQE